MTREEILALTDDGLQREIAKLHGYYVARQGDDYTLYQCMPNGKRRPVSSRSNPDYAWSCAPDYPRDIAEAWPLLEKIRESYRIEAHKPSVVVSLWGTGGYRVSVGRMYADPGEITVSGEKLEAAICRAYLMVKAVSS
jgi:hypothetical protein